MRPTLEPGDRLRIDTRAYRRRRPAVGELVVVVDPEVPTRWLVKRVGAVRDAPDPGGPPELFLTSDNEEEGRDSRRFGPVDAARIVGRVYRRYAPASRRAEFEAGRRR